MLKIGLTVPIMVGSRVDTTTR